MCTGKRKYSNKRKEFFHILSQSHVNDDNVNNVINEDYNDHNDSNN